MYLHGLSVASCALPTKGAVGAASAGTGMICPQGHLLKSIRRASCGSSTHLNSRQRIAHCSAGGRAFAHWRHAYLPARMKRKARPVTQQARKPPPPKTSCQPMPSGLAAVATLMRRKEPSGGYSTKRKGSQDHSQGPATRRWRDCDH
jgi:hypothetical protein